MDHFRQIYTRQAAGYHAMIAAEDVEGQLRSALEAVGPVRGKRVPTGRTGPLNATPG